MITGNFLSEQQSYAIIWTLIHSLWQAGVIYLLLNVLFEFSFFKAASKKYWTAYLALPVLLICSICTFLHLHESAQVNIPHHYQVPINILNTDTGYTTNTELLSNPDILESFTTLVNNHSGDLVWLWMIGILIFSLRIIFGLSYLEKVRFSSSSISDGKWQRKVDEILDRMGCGRIVEIAESKMVEAPQLIGHFKPIILFPIGLFNQLELDEVESILIHELSHVARQDFVFNILQTIMENVYFFNPFVHLISSIVRKEREFACDDSSRKFVDNDLHYAKALYRIGDEVENRSFALGFGGHKNHLLQRVERIFNTTKHTTHYMEKIMTSTVLLALIVLLSMAASVGESPAKLEVNEMYPEKIIPLSIEPNTSSNSEETSFISMDTLPNKKKSTCEMKWFEDGSRVDVSYENGEISSLRINGNEIDAKDYPKFIDEIDDTKNRLSGRIINLQNHESLNKIGILTPTVLSYISDSIDIDSITETVERLLKNMEEGAENTWDELDEKFWHIQIDSQEISEALDQAELQISVWENKLGDKKIHIDSFMKNHPRLNDENGDRKIYLEDFDLDSSFQKIDFQKLHEQMDIRLADFDVELERVFEQMDSAKIFQMKDWEFNREDLPKGIKLDSIMIHWKEGSDKLTESIDSVMRVYRLDLEDYKQEKDPKKNKNKKSKRLKEKEKYENEQIQKNKRKLKSY